MSNYQDRMKAHFSAYKREVLGAGEDAGFEPNDRSTAQILPPDKRHLNLIQGYRAGMVQYLARRPGLTLRRDFHHLSSSQAMGLNLMYPAVASEAGRAALARALDCPGIAASSPLFASVPDSADPHAFDLHLHTGDGAQILFEFRLCEERFGPSSAAADARAEPGMSDLALARLQGLVRPSLLETPAYARFPGLLRALAQFETESDRLYLVIPLGNSALRAEADAFMDQLTSPLREQVRLLPVETLVERLLRHAPTGDPAWHAHYGEFARKYALAGPIVTAA